MATKALLSAASVLVLAGIAATVVAAPAFAAEVAAADGSAADGAEAEATRPSGSIEEVVVVARRRAERLLDVPTAVTAITSNELQDKNIQTIRELAAATPSLVVGGNFTSSFLSFSMRGNVPNANTSGFTDPTVQTYINEFVPIFPSAAALYDLESVEVLRGPQGTLFGRSAIGGAVLFNVRQPGSEFGGFVRGAVGNYDNRELEAGVDIPLAGDRASLRLAGNLIRRDGYTKILNQNNYDLDNRHSDAFRASLMLRPTERIESLTVFNYQNVDQHAGSQMLIAAQPNRRAFLQATPSNPAYAAFLAANPDLAALPGVAGGLRTYLPVVNALGARRKYDNVNPSILIFKDRQKFISNTTTIDLGAVRVKNLISYQTFYLANTFNTDGGPLPIADGATMPDEPTAFNQQSRQFSEEIQISGTSFSDRLDWQAGFYYQKNWDVRPGASASSVSFAFLTPVARHTLTDRDLLSKALFAHGTWSLTDQLSVTLGGRVTWDTTETRQFNKAAATNSRGTVIGPAVCGANLTRPFNESDPACQGPPGRIKDRGVGWVASVDYQITPDTLVYVASRRGYQSALINTNSSILQFLVTPKSQVTDLEVGLKARGTAGAVPWQFTGAAFYQWMKDAHRSAGVVDPRTGIGLGVVYGVQDARAAGVEAELKALPTPWLEVSVFADYLDAKYKEFTTPIVGIDPTDPACAVAATRAQCRTVITGSVDFSKNEFSYTPKYHFGSTVKINLPIPEQYGEASFTASYYYQSKYFFAINQATDPEAIAGGQKLLNLRADLKGAFGSRVNAAVFVKNVTNDTYLVGGAGLQAAVGNTHGVYGEPRMYGAEIRFEF